jgi:hypothetical protein
MGHLPVRFGGDGTTKHKIEKVLNPVQTENGSPFIALKHFRGI